MVFNLVKVKNSVVKNNNTLTIELLLIANYILKEKNINLISNLKNIIINESSLKFIMSMFTTKNIINTFENNIVLNVKSI